MPRATPMPPEERRASILAAARPLLATHGPSFTTKQVAEAAGIAEGTLFRVFPSKHALLLALVDDALDPAPVIERLTALPPAADAAQRVADVLDALHEGTVRVAQIITAVHALDPGEMDDSACERRRPGRPQGPAPEDPHTTGRAQHDARAERLGRAVRDALEAVRDDLTTTPEEAAYLLSALAFALAHPMGVAPGTLTPYAAARALSHGIVRTAPQPPKTPEPSC